VEAIDDGNFHIVSNVYGVNRGDNINANGNDSPDLGAVSGQRHRLGHGYEFDREQPDRGGLWSAQQSQTTPD
jgi:hypothetical protein